MKTIKLFGIGLSIILQVSSNLAISQCKNFVKKVDFSSMDEFSYCGEVKTAQMYQRDSAEVSIKLQPKTKYRVLLEAQEYLGEVALEVLDKNNKLISILIEENEKRYWEIYSDQKEKVELKINFNRSELHKQSNHRINAPGCVVLAVGKLSSEDFVDNSAVSTDL